MKLRHKALAVVLASCVIAPLAVGSAFAASPKVNDLDNHWGRLVLMDTTTNKYIGIGDDLTGEVETDLYDAESDADFFDMPKLGKTASISNLGSGENLKADGALSGGIDYADGSIIEDEFNFDVAANGAVKTSDGKYLGFDEASGRLTTTATARFHLAGSATTDEVSLVAHVDSYDAATGTADISGTATSGFLDDVKISVGNSFVATQADGSWIMRVTGLSSSDDAITVVQSVNGTEYDRVNLTLEGGEVAPAPVVDAVLTSPTQADSDAGTIKPGMVHFTGTATPGAHMTLLLWTYGGREVVSTDADARGDWQGDGYLGEDVYTLGMVQKPVAGDERKSATFPISTKPVSTYTKLSEVRPAADDVVRGDAVSVPLSGKGTPGAEVQVHIGPKDADWKPRALCGVPAKVSAAGTWSCDGVLSRGQAYTLYTYQAKGTESDMVMNAITTGPDLLATSASHTRSGSDIVFTGTATPNSVVDFYTGPKTQSWARSVVSVRTDAYGHYTTPKGWLAQGQVYDMTVYQTIGTWTLPTTAYKVAAN